MAHVTSGRIGYASVHPPTTQTAAVVEHRGVVCDHCSSTPLCGVRFKCSTCPDYDLCAACVDRNDELQFHNPSHLFLRLPNPNTARNAGPVFANRSSWVHTDVSCADCAVKPIVGYRYFCTQCGLSLCELCEQQGASFHDKSHALLKMGRPVVVGE